jgi:hypothetical protein
MHIEILAGKPLGKYPLGRSRMWEGNIKLDLREMIVRMANGWNYLRNVSNGRL